MEANNRIKDFFIFLLHYLYYKYAILTCAHGKCNTTSEIKKFNQNSIILNVFKFFIVAAVAVKLKWIYVVFCKWSK